MGLITFPRPLTALLLFLCGKPAPRGAPVLTKPLLIGNNVASVLTLDKMATVHWRIFNFSWNFWHLTYCQCSNKLRFSTRQWMMQNKSLQCHIDIRFPPFLQRHKLFREPVWQRSTHFIVLFCNSKQVHYGSQYNPEFSIQSFKEVAKFFPKDTKLKINLVVS